jgi:hypothetical protein
MPPVTAIKPAPTSLIACIILVRLTIYLLSANQYGFMSDELYFLDASYHPAFGYVDFPPVIAWLFTGIRILFSESLWIFRLAAALIGVVVVLVAVDICRLTGGGLVARWVTAGIVLFAPGVLSVHGLLTMNVLDQLWWLLSFWLLIQYLDRGEKAFMWGLGAVLGVGIMTKLSIAALALGILAATLALRRDLFRRPETWSAALLAIVISAPFLIWHIQNEFPLLDFIRAYNATPPAAIVLQNPVLGLLITMSPVYALIWIPGAVAILATGNAKLRFLGVAAWAALGIFVLAGVKFYFAVPALILFSAIGANCWERWTGRKFGRRSVVLVAIVMLSGLLAVPIAAPVLPAGRLQDIANYLRNAEAGQVLEEPAGLERYFPHFAEMHGWPELVALTAEAAGRQRKIPSDELLIVAAHYGQAAALNRLDHDGLLPVAYSGHMSYDLWNRQVDFQRGLFVGFTAEELQTMFVVVEHLGSMDCVRCMGRERALRIFFVDEPKLTNAEIRQRIRRYYFF